MQMIDLLPIHRRELFYGYMRKRGSFAEINNQRIPSVYRFLLELHPRPPLCIDTDETCTDLLYLHEVQNMFTERILTDTADVADTMSEPRQSDRHIHLSAADTAFEQRRIFECARGFCRQKRHGFTKGQYICHLCHLFSVNSCTDRRYAAAIVRISSHA